MWRYHEYYEGDTLYRHGELVKPRDMHVGDVLHDVDGKPWRVVKPSILEFTEGLGNGVRCRKKYVSWITRPMFAWKCTANWRQEPRRARKIDDDWEHVDGDRG